MKREQIQHLLSHRATILFTLNVIFSGMMISNRARICMQLHNLTV